MQRSLGSMFVVMFSAASGLACQVGGDPGSSTGFGTASNTSVSSTATTMDGTDTGTESGDTGDADTTESTSSSSSDSSSSDSSTDTGTTGTTSTTGGGGQPDEGMYSMCLAPSDCVQVTTCITLGDPVTDGICSTDCAGANNPANCDPAPQDSTATPTCMVFDDMMGGWRYLCALGCDQGKTCPAGMQCTNVMDGMSAKMVCF